MFSFFSLMLVAFYVFVIFAHSWGFWRVYLSEVGEEGGIAIMGRGAAAGLAGWFWLCLGVGIWNSKSGGGWMFLIWIYGIWFVPLIGIALTLIYWWGFQKLKWRLGIWS